MNVRPHCLKHLSTRDIKTGSVLQNMQARRSGEAEQGNHLGTPLVIPSAAQQIWAVLYCPGMIPWSASHPMLCCQEKGTRPELAAPFLPQTLPAAPRVLAWASRSCHRDFDL